MYRREHNLSLQGLVDVHSHLVLRQLTRLPTQCHRNLKQIQALLMSDKKLMMGQGSAVSAGTWQAVILIP